MTLSACHSRAWLSAICLVLGVIFTLSLFDQSWKFALGVCVLGGIVCASAALSRECHRVLRILLLCEFALFAAIFAINVWGGRCGTGQNLGDSRLFCRPPYAVAAECSHAAPGHVTRRAEAVRHPPAASTSEDPDDLGLRVLWPSRPSAAA